MKNIQQWLDEYAVSHQHETNVMIHWICVPAIFWSITGFLFLITLPLLGNLAVPVLIALVGYYFFLSRTLWIGMLLFGLTCLWASLQLYIYIRELSVWVYLAVFLIARIFQFYGHHLEGKRPSFLKDIQFLPVGPAWLMAKIYKKLHLPI